MKGLWIITKPSGSLPASQSGHATTIIEGFIFANLLISEDPDHHHNLISSSVYHLEPLHKISLQSAHNFLSNVAHKQTDRQANQPTLPKTKPPWQY